MLHRTCSNIMRILRGNANFTFVIGYDICGMLTCGLPTLEHFQNNFKDIIDI